MNYILIRKFIGIIIVICGIASGILVFYSSMQIHAIGSFNLSTGMNQPIQNSDSVSVLLNAMNILLKGFSFGIFGICLALGTMVYKIGSGKESIVLNLKEDKMEAAVQYNKPVVPKQEVNDNLTKFNPGNRAVHENDKENENPEQKGPVVKKKISRQKRNLFLFIVGLLLIIDAVIIVFILKNR